MYGSLVTLRSKEDVMVILEDWVAVTWGSLEFGV